MIWLKTPEQLHCGAYGDIILSTRFSGGFRLCPLRALNGHFLIIFWTFCRLNYPSVLLANQQNKGQMNEKYETAVGDARILRLRGWKFQGELTLMSKILSSPDRTPTMSKGLQHAPYIKVVWNAFAPSPRTSFSRHQSWLSGVFPFFWRTDVWMHRCFWFSPISKLLTQGLAVLWNYNEHFWNVSQTIFVDNH